MKPILNFAVDPIQEQFSKSPRVIQSSNGTVFVCSNYQLKVMKPDRSFQTTVEDAYVEFYGWKESCGTISSQWDMSKYLQYTNSEGVRLNDKVSKLTGMFPKYMVATKRIYYMHFNVCCNLIFGEHLSLIVIISFS